MIDANLLTSFEWPELINPLAIFEIQHRMLLDKKPLWFEQASKEEIEQELVNQFEIEIAALSDFKKLGLKYNRVINYETVDQIRYAFKSYCIIKTLKNITFNDFKQFAKEYNIPTGNVYINFNTDISYVVEISKAKGNCLKTSIYSYICALETDTAIDFFPQQWYEQVKYFDAKGNEVISGVRKDGNNMYVDDVINAINIINSTDEISRGPLSDLEKLIDEI